MTPPRDDLRIQSLLALGRNVVVLGSRIEGNVHFVDCENVQSTRTVMQYLFDLGHRKLGFIGGDLTGMEQGGGIRIFENSSRTLR